MLYVPTETCDKSANTITIILYQCYYLENGGDNKLAIGKVRSA